MIVSAFPFLASCKYDTFVRKQTHFLKTISGLAIDADAISACSFTIGQGFRVGLAKFGGSLGFQTDPPVLQLKNGMKYYLRSPISSILTSFFRLPIMMKNL